MIVCLAIECIPQVLSILLIFGRRTGSAGPSGIDKMDALKLLFVILTYVTQSVISSPLMVYFFYFD